MSMILMPKPLREILGEEGSESLITLLNQNGEKNIQAAVDLAEQRFGKKLTEETANLYVKFDTRLNKELADLKIHFENRLSDEVGSLREEISGLRVDTANKHANTIKWMFIFWVGQIGVITGILLTVVK